MAKNTPDAPTRWPSKIYWEIGIFGLKRNHRATLFFTTLSVPRVTAFIFQVLIRTQKHLANNKSSDAFIDSSDRAKKQILKIGSTRWGDLCSIFCQHKYIFLYFSGKTLRSVNLIFASKRGPFRQKCPVVNSMTSRIPKQGCNIMY
jgi:hypothetical protein